MHGDWDPSPFAPSTTAAWPSLAPLILAPKFSSSPSFLPMSLLTLVHPSCTPLPPPSPYDPYRLSQSTGFGFPVSYTKFPLAICFTYCNVYVSVLLFQSIPPSPPLLCPQVGSLCLHLHCCPANRFISTIFLDSIYMC